MPAWALPFVPKQGVAYSFDSSGKANTERPFLSHLEKDMVNKSNKLFHQILGNFRGQVSTLDIRRLGTEFGI